MKENGESAKEHTILGLEHAGLEYGRPFRFRTVHWKSTGQEARSDFRWECPGDRPDSSIDESIELYVPGRLLGNRTDLHGHEFYEIALVRAGSAIHITEEGECRLQRGDVIIVAPGQIHGFEEYRDFLVTNVYLYPGWFVDDLRPLWCEDGLVRLLIAGALFHMPEQGGVIQLTTTPEETDAWEHEVTDIEREARREKPSLVRFNGCFLKILATLSNAFLREHGEHALPLRREVWAAAEEIEKTIEQGRDLDLEALAGKASMTQDYFARTFREATGFSPTDYYQHRRIQRAAWLLLTTDTSCTAVAHIFGFADGPHFSRVFKRIMGVSPKMYRCRGRLPG